MSRTAILIVLALFLPMAAGVALAAAQGAGPLAGQLPFGVGPSPQQATPGSGFTYQGRITDSGGPVDGTCDLTFRLHDAAAGGTQVGSSVSQNGVAVSDGLFTVQLDFGSGAFDGASRYLEVSVRCPAGSGSFVALAPRQELTAAPYALHAVSAPWSGLTGVPAGFADGTDDDTTSFWSLTGNGGTTAGANFVGTTDNQALELHVSTTRVLRLEPNVSSPNLIGGYSGNSVLAGVAGATVGGGGSSGSTNRVTDNYSTVAGGENNQAGDNAGSATDSAHATVAGGGSNTASESYAAVGGGRNNLASDAYAVVGGGIDNQATGIAATVSGGWNNTSSARLATVGGGELNIASGEHATIAGGMSDAASATYSAIGGGNSNQATAVSTTVGGGDGNTASAEYATIGGGWSNEASAGYATIAGGGRTLSHLPSTGNRVTDDYGTVGGGGNNQAGNNLGTATDSYYATVAGGKDNTASDIYAAVGGGLDNTSSNNYAVIGGGGHNQATGTASTIAGGWTNKSGATFATVGGGQFNVVTADNGTVGGGESNDATAVHATIAGGKDNTASDTYASIGGGELNVARGDHATVGGGQSNQATARYATIAGGGRSALLVATTGNRATDDYTTVGGGGNNQAGNNAGTNADAHYATVAGGKDNTASDIYAAVGGGLDNTSSNNYAVIGGGGHNVVNGTAATVGGGWSNTSSATYATVPGGTANVAAGAYSFAAGRRAKANHEGSFVWGDSTNADVASTANDQFVVRASGGVVLGTEIPTALAFAQLSVDVKNDSLTEAGFFRHEVTSGDAEGIHAIAKAGVGTGTFARGGTFSASGASHSNRGISASALSGTGGTLNNYGGSFSAANAPTNYAGYFNAFSGTVDYGVYVAGGDLRTTCNANDSETNNIVCDDVAEVYQAGESLEPGDVVVWRPDTDHKVFKSRIPYEGGLAGVYSTSPGVLLGDTDIEGRIGVSIGNANTAHTIEQMGDDQMALALAGRAPVKVNLEGGPIRPGDPLTSSAQPGYAMKANRTGRVIGIAMESYGLEESQAKGDKVLMFVNPHHWVNPNDYESLLVKVQQTSHQDKDDQIAALEARLAAVELTVGAEVVPQSPTPLRANSGWLLMGALVLGGLMWTRRGRKAER